jgi:di/tricarboxylate transporter
MKNLALCIGVGIALWFSPAPQGVSAQAWHLLSIFIATIIGIITTPLPLGAVAMLGLGAAMTTKTLTFAQAFSAFASEIPCASRAPTSSPDPRPHAGVLAVYFCEGLLGLRSGAALARTAVD